MPAKATVTRFPASRAASPKGKVAQVIAVTSGKGGVGKTNICANLAITLATQGKRVCVFDADTSLANINILLGLRPTYTLEHLLNGEKQIEEILLSGPGNIDIAPAASGVTDFISLKPSQQKHLLAAIKRLEKHFDYLLIDTAAGISRSLLRFLHTAPYTILTITPEPTSLTDAFSLLKVLIKQDFQQPVYVIVNMANDRESAHDTYKRFRNAVAKHLEFKVQYLGYILRDIALSKAVLDQNPVVLKHPLSLASSCFQSLGNRLDNLLNANRGAQVLSDNLNKPRSLHTSDPQGGDQARPEKLAGDELLGWLKSGDLEPHEGEALLQELTQAWIARFGHLPEALQTLILEKQAARPEEAGAALATTTSTQQQIKALEHRERQGLQRAIRTAQHLASHQIKNQKKDENLKG